MNSCTKYRRSLPMLAGGEVDLAETREMKRHLAACPGCRFEQEKYSELTEIARNIFAGDERLPEFIRTRIAARAAAESRRGWRRLLAPVGMVWEGRSAGLVAGLAACLLAVVALPLALKQAPLAPPPAGTSTVPVVIDKIDMRLEGDKVRLAWSDGNNTAYRVYKSSDPRGLAGAEVHSVRGTVWVDQDPASSPIVYYRIEAVDSPQF